MAYNDYILHERFESIIGQDDVKHEIKSAMLSDRHVVLIGPPGIGKTTLVKNIARSLPDIVVNDCPYHCLPEKPICPECLTNKDIKTKKISGVDRFVRIQGSPDLTAEDLIGDIDPIKAMKFGPLSIEAFTPGKIFKANNGVLFFDELNRCPEKLQNSLLQVLQERRVTIGSYDLDIEANFLFIGTMNPEDSTTEKLSEVLLDRFDLVYVSYPDNDEDEKKITQMYGKKITQVDDEMLSFIVGFVRRLRDSKKVEKFPSVRATLGLYERAQANALIANRRKVTKEDVKRAVNSVITHRIKLKPSVSYVMDPQKFIDEEFESYSQSGDYSSGSSPDSASTDGDSP